MPELKPELSSKNKYWLPKHRYYELKHYCLQYKHWWQLYCELKFKMEVNRDGIKGSEPGKPTERKALIMADCKNAMELVENCCKEACKDEPILWPFLLKGVTEGMPYVTLQSEYEIPCGKDMYYECYRRFFYILSQRRGI